MSSSTFDLSSTKGDLRNQAGELRRHLRQCAANRSRFLSAAQMAERVHGLVAPRFVTTILCASMLMLVCGGL